MSKPIHSSIKMLDTCQTYESKWDYAINVAHKEARSLALRCARLRQAIEIFKANKRDGVPWPGDKDDSAQ